VVDYDWCIGCRYCMTACPYWARHFNWNEPKFRRRRSTPIPTIWATVPGRAGVVEKCHFCTQRTRKGRQPACQEACPTGARIFGNLLDPDSEIRYVLRTRPCSGSRKNSALNRSSGTSRIRAMAVCSCNSYSTACARCLPAVAATGMWLASCCLLMVLGSGAYAAAAAQRAGGHRHERPGFLGLLHLQLRFSGGHRGGGGVAGDPCLHFHREEFKSVVLIGEGLAVAAVWVRCCSSSSISVGRTACCT
jgi:ferredoxin